jgi:hypothetical protein
MSIPTVNGLPVNIDWIERNPHHAFTMIKELCRENGALRGSFRVNMLRLLPGTTHAEIDAAIERAITK